MRNWLVLYARELVAMRNRSGKRRRFSTLALMAYIILSYGCSAGWHRVQPAGQDLRPRTRVQVFAAGRMHRLHAFRSAADSVSGVPFLRNLGCQDCRVSFPLADVDSVMVGDPEGNFLRGLRNTVLISIMATVVACRFFVPCSYD